MLIFLRVFSLIYSSHFVSSNPHWSMTMEKCYLLFISLLIRPMIWCFFKNLDITYLRLLLFVLQTTFRSSNKSWGLFIKSQYLDRIKFEKSTKYFVWGHYLETEIWCIQALIENGNCTIRHQILPSRRAERNAFPNLMKLCTPFWKWQGFSCPWWWDSPKSVPGTKPWRNCNWDMISKSFYPSKVPKSHNFPSKQSVQMIFLQK